MPLLSDGSPITRETVFDKFVLTIPNAHSLEPASRSYIYAGDERVGQIRTGRVDGHRTFDESNPEIIEIQRRLDAGEATLHYEIGGSGVLRPWRELQETLWYLTTIFPFHEAGADPHHFFHALAIGADFTSDAEREHQKFHVPGIVVDKGPRTFYKREDDADAPDVRDVLDLAGEGWTPAVPRGPHRLHAVDVFNGKDEISISRARPMYHRRKDLDGDIRAVARAWHFYWTGLTPAEQGINTRMTARSHVEHAIGRAWDEKPFSSAVSVFYEGALSTAVSRPARDVEDWFLGNLEQWAFEWGFDAMVLALNSGGRRSLLDAQLDDYTFCHVKQNGDVGDLLRNPSDGILEATWNAWGSTDYNAALGTVVTVDAGADREGARGVSVSLPSTATVVNGSGDTTYSWEQVSGTPTAISNPSSATASFTAPLVQSGADPAVFEFKVTAANNGESATDTVVITVNPPASE